MNFIKINNLLINLNQIETAELESPPVLGVPIDRVTLKLVSGNELTFEQEEAEQLQAFFARSSDVHNVMEVSEPFEMPDPDLSDPNSANLSLLVSYEDLNSLDLGFNLSSLGS